MRLCAHCVRGYLDMRVGTCIPGTGPKLSRFSRTTSITRLPSAPEAVLTPASFGDSKIKRYRGRDAEKREKKRDRGGEGEGDRDNQVRARKRLRATNIF